MNKGYINHTFKEIEDFKNVTSIMNKQRILSVGLPMTIRNKAGARATIELNRGEFVVCRFHPHNSVYLSDAHLSGWYPSNALKQMTYYLMGLITDH